MTEELRPPVEGDAVLRFAPHTRFRFDEVRQAWIVLAPERLMLPDEQAVEILQLIDGKHTVDAVIDELAGRYDAPRDVIAGDVVKMLQDLVDKKVLRW
jgi:pyrroloquinoline quinone biosynthesis protein D